MDRRFFYHALGVGLGGRITRPFCDVIEAQAATSLPTIGGYASSHIDDYRFHDIVSVRSARIHAVGSEAGDGSFNTSVSVTIEGLNILDVITADTMTARLASRHRSPDGQPEITALGTTIRGLRIGGHPIDVEFDRELFYQELVYDDFEKGVAIQTKKDEAAAKRFASGKKGILCSLVKRTSAEAVGLKTEDGAIVVPTVGRVFLGETMVSDYARRLTLLRVELGSPVGGRLEACSGEVDGSTYP